MKMIRHIIVMLFSITLIFASSLSWACSPVAKIIFYAKSDIKSVAVIRGKKNDERRLATDMLCEGDRVKVARGVHVTVKYQTKNKFEIELNGPADLPVTSINLQTKLANSGNMLADIGKWFSFNDMEPTVGMVTRGGCIQNGTISTPLDSGHELETPFMLKTDLKKLHFFWCGGAPPYNVEVVGHDDQLLSSQVVSVPSVSFELAGLMKNQTYVLSVRSSDGMEYRRKLLARKLSDSSTDSVVELLFLDSQENWRLQLWSYLLEQKDSQIKTILMNHLQAGDM